MPTTQKVLFKRKTTEEIEQLEIEDGSLIYNVDNGKTYMDYGNERIPTGGGANGGIYVGDTEPTDPDVVLWVDTPTSETKASEIVTEYTESDKVGYCTNYINELNTYSTDEIRVGTWIDGKPIYRKVFNIGTLPNTAIKDTAHGLTNIEVKKIYGYSKRANDNFYVPLPFSSENTSGYNIALSVLNDYIRIATGIDRTAFTETYVTLEYTKTTD